uniref:39S ribosomal protein L17, mitochondrial isoform X2 n=1 Tax=Jaculus jaculus TaxID=51337 RepID=UPI001E1B50A6|nr:39S ribosomal protein L17, mitochondrial isoform X2 [Jaculus jaculus]
MRLSWAAAVSHGRVFRRLGLGPESRIHLLRNLLTGLVRHERIEASWARVDEMRGYAEKLIDYGKLGDTNERAMRVADFWLTGQNGGYTRMLQIPNRREQDRAKMAVIEYKGNCLPPLPLPRRDSNLTLLNQLLQGLRQDLHQNPEASLHSSHTVQTPKT